MMAVIPWWGGPRLKSRSTHPGGFSFCRRLIREPPMLPPLYASRIHLDLISRSYGADMKTLSRFLKDESGATAIEYALIAAGIAVAIITAVNGVGSKLSSTFQAISSSLK